MSKTQPAREEAGLIVPLMACPCGRQPHLISVGRKVRGSCFCGMQGQSAGNEAEAIRLWNLEISERLLEAMR